MPNPVGSASRVNHLLTDYVGGIIQDSEGLAHTRVFPKMPSEEREGFIGRFDRSDWLRNQFAKRPDNSESAGSGWKQDNSLSFYANVWALHKDVGRQAERMAQNPYQALRDATRWLGEQAKLSREVEWVNNFFKTGIWKGIDGSTGDVTGVANNPGANEILQWNATSANPIEDFRPLFTKIQKRIAKRPNKVTMGREVWDVLIDNPKVLERILNSGGVSPSSPAVVMQQALASILEIDEVIVMDGIQVTSAEKKDFEDGMTTELIGGKNVLITYSEPKPTLYTVNAGVTLPWTGYEQGMANDEGAVISDFWMQEKKATRVEAEMAYAQVLTQPEAGIFISGAVA